MVGLFIHDETTDAWPLPQRTPIWQGDRQVGTLSAVVWSHRFQKKIGLGQVLSTVIESGEPVEVEGLDGRSTATTTGLPFI